jgi:putative ABC transport system ATP-binding protein
MAVAVVEYCVASPARYHLMLQRTLLSFAPSDESFQVALGCLTVLVESLSAAGISEPGDVALIRGLISGLAAEQIANDPQGRTFADQADRGIRTIVTASVAATDGAGNPKTTAERRGAVVRTAGSRSVRSTVRVRERTLGGVTGVVDLDRVQRIFPTSGGSITAIDGVNVSIGAGSFVAVMGATGSGKSTLLHCAAGLDRPTNGTVRLCGHDVGRMSERALAHLRRRRVGFVFQSYNLLSELTVEQNVLLPHRLGAPLAMAVAEALGHVGLGGTERRPVGELSGGQRQRVAMARALVTGPEVVFADEPTGALDPTTGQQILQLLRAAVDDRGVTVVMVTHDPLAAAVSDRLILLRAGRVVVDTDTPDAATIATELRGVG